MNLDQFIAGSRARINDYQYFIPEKINQRYEWPDIDLIKLCETATLRLGELNAFSELVPNINHFIRMHVVKEATVSSKIEGTQTNMEEAVQKEEFILPEKRNDWREVHNYIMALDKAIESLQKIPLSTRTLKAAHKMLLHNVRGEHKLPGEFRRSQNWIGGANLAGAVFIPPVADMVDTLMGDLENFIHSDDTGLPHAIKVAIAHYQFETIHPFLDGNGRIGRLMISLYFAEQKILRKPVLYLSDFFERNQHLYYDKLMRVRTHNEIIEWIKFVLTGIIETAEKATQGLRNTIALKQRTDNKVLTLGKRAAAAKLLSDALFEQPVIDVNYAAEITNLSKVSANKLVADFLEAGILQELTGQKRNRLFRFTEYFNIFN